MKETMLRGSQPAWYTGCNIALAVVGLQLMTNHDSCMLHKNSGLEEIIPILSESRISLDYTDFTDFNFFS